MKRVLSRRKLLGDIGKLAYVAPTLTVLSLGVNNTHAMSVSVPCPPNDPCGSSSKSSSTQQQQRRKRRPG